VRRCQAAFEFDDVASTASQDEMLAQIPQALPQHRAGIQFKQFFVDRVTTTPATETMVEQAVLQLVRDRQVQVIGPAVLMTSKVISAMCSGTWSFSCTLPSAG
jgi:hypothetical protein